MRRIDRTRLCPRLGTYLLCTAVLALGCAAGRAPRPKPDASAMRDALAQTREVRYASSRAYVHFLQAMLAKDREELFRAAIEELRLAVIFDPEAPYLRVALADLLQRGGSLDRAALELEETVKIAPRYAPAHLALGPILAERRRPRPAQAELERAIALEPLEPQAYLELAQVHLDLGSEELAVEVIEALSKAQPGEPVGYKALGRWYAQRGQAEAASRFLERASQRDPSDAETLVLLAKSLEAKGSLDKADAAYQKAIGREPDDPELLQRYASMLLTRHSVEAAKAYFDRLLVLRPEEPEVRAKVAFEYVRVRRYAEAAELFSQARALDPADASLAFFHGRVLEQQRDWTAAAAAFAAVGDTSELYPQAVVHRVHALSQSRAHEAAVRTAREALAREPAKPEYLLSLADAQEQAGQGLEAEKLLTDALEKSPQPALFRALGALHQRGGRTDRAVQLLEEGVRASPRDAQLLFALGVLLEKKGDLDASLARMRAVLEVEPDNADAMNFIGYSLAEQGKSLNDAEALVRRALAAEPENGAYLDSLGWVHFKKGDYKRAVESLEKASTLLPDEPVIAEHLGDAYAAVDRRAEAQKAYRQALSSLPAGGDAVARARLEAKLRAPVGSSPRGAPKN